MENLGIQGLAEICFVFISVFFLDKPHERGPTVTPTLMKARITICKC